MIKNKLHDQESTSNENEIESEKYKNENYKNDRITQTDNQPH
jgi:hypothetical protein